MWSVYGKTGLFMITTNPIITKEGKLVMGRGIAKQMRDNFPGSDKEFAKMVRGFPHRYTGEIYYEPVFGKQAVGYFMVKHHWRDKASIPVIMRSVAELIERAENCSRIDLNFPGVGNGRLDKELVKPLLEYLPDNVNVWQFKND